MNALFIHGAAGGSALLFLAGFALALCGLALVAYYYRAKREIVVSRRDLATARDGSRRAGAGLRARAAEPSLVRLAGQEIPEWQREIVRRLTKLRLPATNIGATLAALRTLSVMGAAACGWLLVSDFAVNASSVAKIVAATGAGVLGWFLPYLAAKRLVKRRAESVEAGLPDALELLVVCVEAGLSLEDAITKVAKELKLSQPELAEELDVTSADLRILPNRDQALLNLARRIDVPSIRSVVTTLSQTMRYGTPLAQAMRVAAADLRDDSLLQLEERANKLPALLTLPLMLFMMPTIFLIVGGPAALRLIDAFMR